MVPLSQAIGGALEELLELHGLAHVALDLQLPRHVGGGRVLLAAGDLHERLRGRRDRAVGVAAVLADGDLAVVHVDRPDAGAVDLEQVGRGQAGGLGRVDSCLERLEEFAGAVHARRAYTTGSGVRRRLTRDDGSSAASTNPGTAAAAAAYIAVRRSTESASAPSAMAAIPPRPIESPIERPDAIPIRRGRYSWLITIVTPKVLITHTPTSASATAPSTPPTSTYASVKGPTKSMLATSTGLRPRRSAIGPAARVPSPPASSISESRWLPCDLEWPSETSQSGTNVISPNQATLRNAITPSSSASAPGRSSPATERAPLSGAKLPRNGTAASKSAATTRHGTASRRPPVSPNASTSGVVAVGPSA